MDSSAAAPPHGSAESSGAEAQLARALRGDYQIRVGDWLSRGWGVFTGAGALFLGYSAILWLLLVFPPHLGALLSPMMVAGFYFAAIKVRRGSKLQFSDFWLPFNDFIPLLLACLVSLALMFAGLCTFGILTLYLWVAYSFAYVVIVDRRMEFWDALELSRKVVTRRWLGILAFAICLFLLNLIAFLATLSLGLIVTVPFTCCALVEAYADIFGAQGGVPGRASPHRAPGGGEAPASVAAS